MLFHYRCILQNWLTFKKKKLKALLSEKALSSTRWSSPASGFYYEICIYFVLF